MISPAVTSGSGAEDRARGKASKGEERFLDLRGLRCPLPVLKTAKRLAAMESGERIAILADDPMAAIDLPLFCRQEGQALLAMDEAHGARRFLVERGPAPPRLGRK